jgi:hypothetical protein
MSNKLSLRVRGLLENWQSWTGAPSRGGSAISAANTIKYVLFQFYPESRY